MAQQPNTRPAPARPTHEQHRRRPARRTRTRQHRPQPDRAVPAAGRPRTAQPQRSGRPPPRARRRTPQRRPPERSPPPLPTAEPPPHPPRAPASTTTAPAAPPQMTMSHLPSRLPRQIRPVAGEGLTSFIERLATANHIKTSYLRRYLVDPPWSWNGSPSWERLAAVVGREPSSLKKILLSRQCVACGVVTFQPVGGSPRQTCSQACRQEAYRRRNPKPQKEENTQPAQAAARS